MCDERQFKDMLPQVGGPTEKVNIDRITFDGSEDFQARLRSLREEYWDVFPSSVRPQAAHAPPMVLTIDANKLRASGQGRSNSPGCVGKVSRWERDESVTDKKGSKW